METLRSKSLTFREWIWLILVTFLPLLFIVSLLLPGGQRAREPARRIKCSSNLRQIGLAMKMYADAEPDHAYPLTFGRLLETQEITADVFLCPATDLERATGIDVHAIASLIDDPDAKHCSYLYAGAGLKETADLDPDLVLAFERPGDHQNEGINVLYADGHVDWVACREGDAAAPAFDRFFADFKAGKRPLKFPTPTGG